MSNHIFSAAALKLLATTEFALINDLIFSDVYNNGILPYDDKGKVQLEKKFYVDTLPQKCGCKKLGQNCLTDECTNFSNGVDCNGWCKNASCGNNRLSDKNFRKVIIEVDKKKGLIIKAGEPIQKGDCIAKQAGFVIKRDRDNNEELRRWQHGTRGQGGRCSVNYGDSSVIDSTKCGSAAGLASHSCDPNSTLKEWVDKETQLQLVLVATKDIPLGTEITVCYAQVDYRPSNDYLTPCLCKSDNCKKIVELGGKAPDLNTPLGAAVYLSRTPKTEISADQALTDSKDRVQHWAFRDIGHHPTLPLSRKNCQLCYAKHKIHVGIGVSRCIPCNIDLCQFCSAEWHDKDTKGTINDPNLYAFNPREAREVQVMNHSWSNTSIDSMISNMNWDLVSLTDSNNTP